jgi:ABC-type cobalt transport system substrate-binding protein
MSNDEAMLFGAVVMLGTAFIIFYLIGKNNDK